MSTHAHLLCCPLKDHPEAAADMATRFDECVAFINSARDANGMHTHVARARAHMPPSDCESKAKQPSLYLKPSTTQPTPPLPHTPGRVLVHCRGGVSRSSTVVVGYLMAQARSRVSTPPNPPTSKPMAHQQTRTPPPFPPPCPPSARRRAGLLRPARLRPEDGPTACRLEALCAAQLRYRAQSAVLSMTKPAAYPPPFHTVSCLLVGPSAHPATPNQVLHFLLPYATRILSISPSHELRP